MKPGSPRLPGMLAGLLILNAAISIAALFHAKKKEAPARACAIERRRWGEALEEIESTIRRWEMLAPECLSAGFPWVERMGDGSIALWEVESARAVLEPASSANTVTTSAHTFLAGQTLWACAGTSAFPTVLESFEIGSKGKTSNLRLSASPGFSVVPGMLLAQARRRVYRSVPRKDGSGWTVLEQVAKESPRPAFTSVRAFDVRTSSAQGRTIVSLRVEAEGCEASRTFSMDQDRPPGRLGQWTALENALTYLSWEGASP